ncbi:uncharacterized protein LOC144122870 [Amblyomma americanum]
MKTTLTRGSYFEETAQCLCDELAVELGSARVSALSVERQVLCALRFFASGGFQGAVGNEENVGAAQPTVNKPLRRAAETNVNVGSQKGSVRFPGRPEEKAAAKEGVLCLNVRRGSISGVVGCVYWALITIKESGGSAANEPQAVLRCGRNNLWREHVHPGRGLALTRILPRRVCLAAFRGGGTPAGRR